MLLFKMCSYIGCARESQRVNAREWSFLVGALRPLVYALEMKPPLLLPRTKLWNLQPKQAQPQLRSPRPQPRRALPQPGQLLPPLWRPQVPQPKLPPPHQHKRCKCALWQRVDALGMGKVGVTIATPGFPRIGAMLHKQTVKHALAFGAMVVFSKCTFIVFMYTRNILFTSPARFKSSLLVS